MKKLSELFWTCNTLEYDKVGNDVSYKFIEENDTLYLYLQGSYEKIDWFRNFYFFPISKKPYKDMKVSYKVHRGFLRAWKELEDIVIAKITEKDENNSFKWKKIIIVGYSHGGSLAMLATESVWYYREDLRDNKFHGFGFEAPRVYAGYKVKKELKERWKNFTVIRNNNDLVTHCPPALFGFTHVGNLLKIKGDTSSVKNKLPKCIKSHFPEPVHDGIIKKEKECYEK